MIPAKAAENGMQGQTVITVRPFLLFADRGLLKLVILENKYMNLDIDRIRFFPIIRCEIP